MAWKLAQHLRPTALKTAKHEMGHYVIARAMGFRTGDVCMAISEKALRGGAEVFLDEAIPSMSELLTYLRRRALVLCAGAAAETLPESNSPKPKLVDRPLAVNIICDSKLGAEQDYAKFRELVRLIRNVTCHTPNPLDESAVQEELDAIDAKLWNRSADLVDEHADLIVRLGDKLAQRAKKEGEEVRLNASELEALPGVRGIERVPPLS